MGGVEGLGEEGEGIKKYQLPVIKTVLGMCKAQLGDLVNSILVTVVSGDPSLSGRSLLNYVHV